MPRRKRQWIDDSDPDSSGGSEEEENDSDDPYQKKRRKTNGKESAIYGSFADDDDENVESRSKRTDWTKAPAFVSGDPVELEQELENDTTKDAVENDDDAKDSSVDDEHDDAGGGDGDEDGEEDEEGGEDEQAETDDQEQAMEIEPEQVEEPPRGGLGMPSGNFTPTAAPSFSSSQRGGIGSARGGIGSSSLPSAFGTAAAASSSKPSFSNAPTYRPPQPVSATDRAAFSKYEGSIGAKMMAKMGYQTGTGLGASGEGIVAPVETKLRPRNAGIAFKGFEERTDQSKTEAKRRAKREGKVVSDDEEDRGKRKGKGKATDIQKKKISDAWRKPAKRKVKVEHKTYEQILSEAGDAHIPVPEKIFDATRGEIREVSSIADISIASWTPSTDPTRIPEVRHNLRLICESCKTDMDGLAREAKVVVERQKYIQQEDVRLRKLVEQEAILISRLQQVHLVVDEIDKRVKEVASSSKEEATLELFKDVFDQLVNDFSPEFERYKLDEIVAAAIAPTMKAIVLRWSPLEEPDAMTATLRRWRSALKASYQVDPVQTQLDIYNGDRFGPVKPTAVLEKPMTPYESLLWNVWLPKVRSVLNNDWSPTEPAVAVRLFECWTDLLPAFLRDNFLDQLIVPKLQNAIEQWHPKKSETSLQAIIFPWLPHLGLRMEELMQDAQRKVKGLFRSWMPSGGLPKDLLVWKDVFDPKEWMNLLLKYVVPKLAAALREDFEVNPAQQDMDPFKWVMEWHTTIKKSIFSRILETEFFPKWLEILYQWLIQPKASFDEIADWYVFWKGEFPEEVQQMTGVQKGFMLGQQLMNDAVSLGPKARSSKLVRPDYTLLTADGLSSPTKPVTGDKKPPPRKGAVEITFKMLVDERAASHNLLFMPSGRTHEKSRMPVYRVSSGVDGKGGIDVVIMDDAVWLVESDGNHFAISLDDMILRATKKK